MSEQLARLPSGRWAPGTSGNMSGRPPSVAECRLRIAHLAWKAEARLQRNIEFGSDAASNQAAIWVLEQHIGKAQPQIEGQVTDLGAAHLLAVSALGDSNVILDVQPEPEPEPAPLLDWAGLPSPVQRADLPTPEFDPLPDRGRRR